MPRLTQRNDRSNITSPIYIYKDTTYIFPVVEKLKKKSILTTVCLQISIIYGDGGCVC